MEGNVIIEYFNQLLVRELNNTTGMPNVDDNK